MENKIIKREKTTPAFVENAMASLEQAKEYANIILDSKLAPSHFYLKKPDNKPDYSQGNTAAIIMVMQHGLELGMSVSQSLQLIVPVNGMLSLKGDGAKSLIFNSGLCEKWEEREEGSIGNNDYKYIITAKRKGLEEKTVDFSVAKAMRAGLWIDQNAVSRNPRLKYSPWWKYPNRMIMYRAVGFISRDLFSDVLSGMLTQAEAEDYEHDIEATIELKSPTGKEIKVKPEIEDVTTKIKEQLKQKDEKIEDVKVIKDTPESNTNIKQEIKVVPKPEPKKQLSEREVLEQELRNMGARIYKDLERKYPDINVEHFSLGCGRKKTNKMCRDIILEKLYGEDFDAYIYEEYGDTIKNILAKGKEIAVSKVETPKEEPKKEEPKKQQKKSIRDLSNVVIPELSGDVRRVEDQITVLQSLDNIGIEISMIDEFLKSKKTKFKDSDDVLANATQEELLEICSFL